MLWCPRIEYWLIILVTCPIPNMVMHQFCKAFYPDEVVISVSSFGACLHMSGSHLKVSSFVVMLYQYIATWMEHCILVAILLWQHSAIPFTAGKHRCTPHPSTKILNSLLQNMVSLSMGSSSHHSPHRNVIDHSKY